jgi:nickel/cobalt transporter (NiCoT) family protein
MLQEIAASFQSANNSRLRTRIVGIYIFLIVLNVGAWTLALTLFWEFPKSLSLCLIAYGLGLRHAVDADHIAAIDNVTRKLMEQNKRPAAVGFFFSLGHSAVVVLMCLAVALGTDYLRENPHFKELGELIGTTVSAAFLLLIAFVNLGVFIRVFRVYRTAQSGSEIHKHSPDSLLSGRSFLAHFLRPLFNLVNHSWHMFPIGFLFGLGFDTASSVSLLGIGATQAAQELPIWSIMVFPLLFTAGMCLIDTTDGVIMLGAYGWAFIDSRRKLLYNMIITLCSFVIAFVIGGLEALGLIADKFGLEGGIWNAILSLNQNSGLFGYAIIAVLLTCWLISLVIYRFTNRPRRGDLAPPASTIGDLH